MTPEEYQALLDAGWTAEEIQNTFGVAPPGGAQGAPASGGTAGTSAYGSKPDNVPEWLWQRYVLANEEYNEAWNDNKQFDPADVGDGSKKTRFNNARALLTSVLGQMDNYMPKQGASAEDAALKRRMLEAQVVAAEQKVGASFNTARQQHYSNIDAIKGMLERGEVDETEADRMIGTSKSYMEAAMQGATPWDIEKTGRSNALRSQELGISQQRLGLDRDDLGFRQRKQREDLTSGMLGDRMRTGTGLAETLINTIVKSYRDTPSSVNPPYNLNPFRQAKRFVDDMGYGEENAELARALLKGALGGQ